MFAPMMLYRRLKPISIYFPKRLLLSFLVVFAFPIALGNRAQGLVNELMQVDQCPFIVNQISQGSKGKRNYLFCLLLLSFTQKTVTYFHDWIGRKHFLLHIGVICRAANCGEETHSVLCRNRLSSTRFSTDYNRLIPLVSARHT